MAKILFIPFSIIGSLIAGLAARQLFARVWSLFDEEEPPDASDPDADWRKVVIGSALQAAVFAAVRAFVDRRAREAFLRTTGAWPGERADA